MKITEILHNSHPHVLKLRLLQVPYECNGCKELGFSSCYECEYEDCNFHLHEECAKISSSSSPSSFHRFFSNCKFVFQEETHNRYCDACGKDILGFSYQCTHKEHDLHPNCVKLQETIIGDGIRLKLSKKVPSKCLKCGSKETSNEIEGWSYVSSCDNKLCYHVACVKDLILENWKKSYFQGLNKSDNLDLQIVEVTRINNGQLVQKSGGSSIRKNAKKLWRMAKMVLKLIISAIFGDPSVGIAMLIESLVSNSYE